MAYILFQQKKWFSEEQYCDTLKNFTFIHHNLEYGLPFENESVHFIYASHLIEHIFKLEKYLREAGFKKVYRCSFKQGRVPDIDRLDNRPEQSLFVEAVK
ncbi:class I SAM-dependent methyltransferase [Caldithrix abyssi]|uniref:Methyltransferase type 11 n=1 Tax=Caldithrix abyssi DSM 13497 TaxID=880073 RepID=A0A1J1CAF8_CALAY|nr:class I SAM-dependent methyltransferase [Caldithrix abyssi]APF18896.1 hypothetical protein Cabys_2147 [Caldithrix abyssi DSM 13497]